MNRSAADAPRVPHPARHLAARFGARRLALAVLGALAVTGTAHAGLLDAIKKAQDVATTAQDAANRTRDTADKTQDISGRVRTSTSTSTSTSGNAGTVLGDASNAANAGGDFARVGDVAIRALPGATLLKLFSNPLERGTLPLSPPDRINGASERTSAWRLPFEGRTAIAQYRHRADDSPLQIAERYAGQIKAQGFELLTLCNAPCTSGTGLADSSVYWLKEFDPLKRIEFQALGDKGTYFIGHRWDAVIAVRVGQNGDQFVSTVKIVQSPTLDRQPLFRYIEAVTPPDLSEPLPPPVAGGKPGRTPPVAAANPRIRVITPAELPALIAQNKGRLVLALSSSDPACPFSRRGNKAFEALAAQTPADVPLVRVDYNPWTSIGNDPSARQLRVLGLPTFFTLQDSEAVRSHFGAAPGLDALALRSDLLDGLSL